MSFNWSQYLDVAQELAEQAKHAPPALQEARYRASISRAYYAVFGRAHHHLRHHDRIQGSRLNPHEYVRETFKNSPDQDRREIGETLDRLRQNRNKADYDLEDAVFLRNLPLTVPVTLTWAKEALAILNRLQKQ